MMRNLVILILVGVLGESIAARAAVVEVVAAFEGNRGPGFKAAANVQGAVGPHHIVDFTDHACADWITASATGVATTVSVWDLSV